MSGLNGQPTASGTAAGPGWRLEPLRRLRRADADGAAAALAGALAAEAAAAARRAGAAARAEAAWGAAEAASPGAGALVGAVGAGGAGRAGGSGDSPGGWASRAAWAERLELAACGLDAEAVAAGAELRLATEEVARCRADHARAAAAARLLDEARGRWVAARRRERERAAEAEADDRPWPGAG